MDDPYKRPSGRCARILDSARYAAGFAMVGAASVVGIAALGFCVACVMSATVVSPRAARVLMY
jgi:hypothetical protein